MRWFVLASIAGGEEGAARVRVCVYVFVVVVVVRSCPLLALMVGQQYLLLFLLSGCFFQILLIVRRF